MGNKDLNKEKVRKYLQRMGYKKEEVEKLINGPAYKYCLQQVLACEKAIENIYLEDQTGQSNRNRR